MKTKKNVRPKRKFIRGWSPRGCGWHYGLKKKNNYYELAEIYGENCWTANALKLKGASVEEIIDKLKMMIKDLEKPDIIILDE